jgi:hypothetical protein
LFALFGKEFTPYSLVAVYVYTCKESFDSEGFLFKGLRNVDECLELGRIATKYDKYDGKIHVYSKYLIFRSKIYTVDRSLSRFHEKDKIYDSVFVSKNGSFEYKYFDANKTIVLSKSDNLYTIYDFKYKFISEQNNFDTIRKILYADTLFKIKF